MLRTENTPSMLQVEYTPIEFEVLAQRTHELINKYTGDNIERIRLIRILEALVSFLGNLKNQHETRALRDITTGGYLFCMLLIGENANSSLHDLLMEAGEMEGVKFPNKQQVVIYLEKFFSFLTSNNPLVDKNDKTFAEYLSEFANDLEEKKQDKKSPSPNLNIARLKKEIGTIVSSALSDAHTVILDLSKRLHPTHEQLAKEIESFPNDYMAAKSKQEEERAQSYFGMFQRKVVPNEDRVFLTQLGAISSKLVPMLYKDIKHLDKLDEKKLNRQERVLLGHLIFIARSIDNTYLSSLFNFSKAEELALLKLHVLSLDDPHSYLSKKMQLECLSTYKSFLQNDQVRAMMESEGQEKYKESNTLNSEIDSRLDRMIKELASMNDSLANESKGPMQYRATIRLSQLGSILGDATCPISGGSGAFIGFLLSKTTPAAGITNFATKTITSLGIPGTVLNFIGIPYGVTFAVEAGAMIGTALMAYYIWKTTLYLTGGAIGLVIDGSAHEIKECYGLLKEKMEKAKEHDTDFNFVKSLRQFPKECFSYQEDYKRVQLLPIETLIALRKDLEENYSSEFTKELEEAISAIERNIGAIESEKQERKNATAEEESEIESFEVDDFNETASPPSLRYN